MQGWLTLQEAIALVGPRLQVVIHHELINCARPDVSVAHHMIL